MAHDAFVSYSKDDKETVDSICKVLEEIGLSCWYAPRDVPIGADWDTSIMEALAASRVMILVWSTHSDTSKQVKREVALALDEIEVTVIPFRTESIEPSKLRYYLNGIQWLDASTPPSEANLRHLVEQVKIAIPVVGQLLVSDEELIERSRRPTAAAPGPVGGLGGETEQQTSDKDQTKTDEKTGPLSEVETLQGAEAEALEEAEAAAFRQARLRAEVESLRRADAGVLPPAEAEVLRRASEADAVHYAKEKARHVAKVERLHRAVETALERAEEELGANKTEETTALNARSKT